MHRLLVALLALIDAAIAAAVGLGAILAPLTLLWTLGAADWGQLWPLTAALWQFSQKAPLQVQLPQELVTAWAIDPAGAAFSLSLAPLALLVFVLAFAARSGARAARAGAWGSGVVGGFAGYFVITAAVAWAAGTPELQVDPVPSFLFPGLLYLIGVLSGAFTVAWREGDGGLVDGLRSMVHSWGAWAPVPEAIVRGSAVAGLALVGAGGIALALAVAFRGGEVVALFQAGHTDLLGSVVLTVIHLAYLPVLLIWAVSWLAGPGFLLGEGTSITAVGAHGGMLPGLPILGLIPTEGSIWALVVILVPVGAGALAGWVVRSRLTSGSRTEGFGPRAVIALGIGVGSAVLAALAALLASGSLGPGRMAQVGPEPGPIAVTIGVEALIGAAILLLAPQRRSDRVRPGVSVGPEWISTSTEKPPVAAPMTDLAVDEGPRIREVGSGQDAPVILEPDEHPTIPLPEIDSDGARGVWPAPLDPGPRRPDTRR